MNKLLICKRARKIAADSLYKALKRVLKSKKPVSEVDLRDAWLYEMRKHKEIFPDGWYVPPAHGIGVFFANSKNVERLNFTTLRKREYWPRRNIYLDKIDGIVSVYASPVDKKTGLIGDFGLTFYLGKNKDLISHLQQVYSFNNQIFKHLKVGMKFKEIYNFSENLYRKKKYVNSGWPSYTDPAGINVGHTIPPQVESWSNEEIKEFRKNKSWKKILKIISQKRIFLNKLEGKMVESNLLFTLEARVRTKKSSIPVSFFHTIVCFHNDGRKELLTNFDKIFRITGMNYMLR